MSSITTRLPAALLLAAALACTSAPANGQVPVGSERADIGNIRGDIWSVWTSPARMDRRDLLAAAGTLGAAAIVSRIDSVGWIWIKTHDRTLVMRLIAPLRDSTKIPLHELGSGIGLLPVSALLYVTGRLTGTVDLRDAGLGCAAGHLSSLGIRQVVFRAVKRARPAVTSTPYQISVPGSSEWPEQSFYSGHVSNSMACSSFLAHRFALGVAEPLPYAFSLAMGLARLADGYHWVSDMMVGTVMGYAIGRTLAGRQLRRHEEAADVSNPAALRAGWSMPIVQWTVVF